MPFVCERCGAKSIAIPYVEKVKDKWYHFCSSTCAKEYKAFNELGERRTGWQSERAAGIQIDNQPVATAKLRCALCGLRLVGRIYKRKVREENLLFCCKGCADHYEEEILGKPRL